MDNSGKITSFDKSHYEQLINYLTAVGNVLNTTPAYLGTSPDLKLDATLGARLQPGSQDWPVAKNFTTQAGTFGSSAHTRLTGYEADVRAFYTALKNAKDIFDETDDLSHYDASKFDQHYPDVSGGGGSTSSTTTT